jgi:hypothetical protein
MFKKAIQLSLVIIICSCSDEEIKTVNLNIKSASNADAGSSNSISNQVALRVDYYSIPSGANTGALRDAVAYLDANGDGFTDVFIATGEYLLEGEVNSMLGINNGSDVFTSSTAEFNNSMPPATHARKSITGDFNKDGLEDVFVFDHGYDADPFPGNNPKLIIQNSSGNFSWSKLTQRKGFHHGGASADVDNDGDIDVFVGGFEPFFFINNGSGQFTIADDRFDRSISKVFTAELIDVDKDGFVDLLVGAHEHDGDQTSIYWGSSSGSYSKGLRTVLPAFDKFGTVLDFDAEDFDKDGDRDIVINRTGGGASNFYVSSRIQLLLNNGSRQFTDATNKIDNPGVDTDNWFPWLRARDVDNDGDIDLFPDNKFFNFTWINDGSGNFTRK